MKRAWFRQDEKMNVYVFDLDGTLLDSMEVWDHLGEIYLRTLGKKPERGLSEKTRNMSWNEFTAYLRKTYHICKTQDMIARELEEMIKLFYHKAAQEKSGAAEYVKYLASRGETLFAVSDTTRENTMNALEHLGILDDFQGVYTAETMGRKNSRNFYLRLALHLHLEPQEITVWEDSYRCAKAAKEAGCRVYAVEEDTERNRMGIINAADRYVKDFRAALQMQRWENGEAQRSEEPVSESLQESPGLC